MVMLRKNGKATKIAEAILKRKGIEQPNAKMQVQNVPKAAQSELVK